MKIITLTQGPFATNCYILTKNTKSVVIDPHHNLDSILEAIQDTNLESIILTHGHIDHISVLTELKEKYPHVPVYCHKDEEIYLIDPKYNLSTILFGEPYTYSGPVSFLQEGDDFSILGYSVEIFHTPGHSLGSLSYYFPTECLVFSGDVLFLNSVGRTDFIGCNQEALISSIKQKLYKLSNNTKVYSGHGEMTTIGAEKKNNLYTQ